MMRRAATWAFAAAASLVALGGATPACAQVSGYELPPGPASPRPEIHGPVDMENPVVRPRTPPPSPQPVPTSTPTSTATLAPPRTSVRIPEPDAAASPSVPRAAERPSPAAPAPKATPAPTRQPALAAPVAPTVADEPMAAPEPIAPPPAPASPLPAPAVEQPAAEQPSGGPPWLWLGLGLLLAAVAFIGARVLRRRQAADPAPLEDIAVENERELVPGAPRAPPPAPVPAPASVVSPTAPAPEPEPIELQLEVRKLSLSLVYATLSYELTLHNHGEEPTGPLRIAGDLISAHRSRPQDEQLLLDSPALELRHELPAMAAGEAQSVAGELRLPLAAILPIRSRSSNLFIPLARFRVEDLTQGERALTRIFAVGQTGDRPEDALRPVNLDLGPRTIRELDQRAVPLPARAA